MMPNTISNPDFDTDFSMNRESILGEQLSHGTTVSGTEDISLLQRIRQGDQAAMAELFDRHGRAVFSVAVHILKDDGHAEDVMQEIFFQIWQNSDSFVQALGSLRTWLVAVARNRSIDVLRRRKPTSPLEKIILASRCNLALEAEHNAMIEKVVKAMKELPEAQQEAMNLAFFQDLSHAEVALRTGEPLGTIKTRIRLALIALRKTLVA
jgi:RNA polymerase sigma-70 factor (ECF subfamily)